MRTAASLVLTTALAACSGAQNDIDATSADRSSPTMAATPTAQETSATPASSWTVRDNRALYGPPESEATIALVCDRAANGRKAIFVQRVVGAAYHPGATRSMTFAGSDATARVEVESRESVMGGSMWSGQVSDPAAFANAIGQDGDRIAVTIAGNDAIEIAPSEQAAQFVRACG